MDNYSQYTIWQEQDGGLVPVLSVKDFVKGFQYQAWVGYEWVDVEVGKTGFSKEQIKEVLDKKIARSKEKPLTVIGDIESIKGRKDLREGVDFKIENGFFSKSDGKYIAPENQPKYYLKTEYEEKPCVVLIDNKPDEIFSLQQKIEDYESRGLWTEYNDAKEKLSKLKGIDNKQKEAQEVPYNEEPQPHGKIQTPILDVPNTDAEKKAKELVEKYYQHFIKNLYSHADNRHKWNHAKQCALIAVDEIPEVIGDEAIFYPVNNFWNQVRQSISKL